jgi:hypothetical protein
MSKRSAAGGAAATASVPHWLPERQWKFSKVWRRSKQVVRVATLFPWRRSAARYEFHFFCAAAMTSCAAISSCTGLSNGGSTTLNVMIRQGTRAAASAPPLALYPGYGRERCSRRRSRHQRQSRCSWATTRRLRPLIFDLPAGRPTLDRRRRAGLRRVLSRCHPRFRRPRPKVAIRNRGCRGEGG